jgi:hypothetical protein
MIVNSNIEIRDRVYGWRQPSTYHIRGTVSGTNNSIFSSGSGYTAVVYNYTFAPGEAFIVIAYWAHNYRGTGFVYGPNVKHTDFDGYSADGYGPYCGALNTSGFPNGYSATFFGQYHAPLASGGAATTGYWFKWQRSSNTLSLQYSTEGPSGPWTNFNSAGSTTIASTDAVCIVVGEAGDTEVSPLRLESTPANIYHNGRAVFAYTEDYYRFSLNLIKGFAGGGYIGSTHYSSIVQIAYATDAWSTTPYGLSYTTWYGTGFSGLSNGYVNFTGGNNFATDRFNFPTQTIQAIAARTYSSNGSPSATQQGVGYLPVYNQISTSPTAPAGAGNSAASTYNTLASYGTKGYEVGKQTTNWEALTFATEAWQTKTSGPSGGYGIGWFDKDYSWQYASAYGGNNTVTNRMPHSTETWSSITTTSSPGALGMPSGGAEKGVNSKQGKFYLAGNWGGSYNTTSDGNRIFKFVNATSTWSVNTGSQTRWNNEHCGLMGMNSGYFAGGYNATDGQNAHTDKINYNLDTIVQLADAPRSLSSASPMWSSY